MASEWELANPSLGWLSADSLRQSLNDGVDSDSHAFKPQGKRVGLMAWGGDLIDSYVKRQIGIHVHVHTWLPSDHSKRGDFAFVFEHESGMTNDYIGEGSAWRSDKHGLEVVRPRTDDVEASVAVDARPVMKDAERPIYVVGKDVRFQIGRSVVRLYGFNDVPLRLREWRDLPTGVLEVLCADWELKHLFVGWRSLLSVDARQFVNTGIQRCPELIQELANQERNLRWDGRNLLDEQASYPIRIDIEPGRVRIFFDVGVPCTGRSLAVGVRPFDATPTNVEWFGGHRMAGETIPVQDQG